MRRIFFLLLFVYEAFGHAGHTHEYSGTGECFGSIVAGGYISDDRGSKYVYGDWLAGIVTTYDASSTDDPITIEGIRPVAIASVSGDNDASAAVILHQSDEGMKIRKFIDDAYDISPPEDCAYAVDIRLVSGGEDTYMYLLNGPDGVVCRWRIDESDEWNTVYTPAFEYFLVWPTDYVAFFSFDVVATFDANDGITEETFWFFHGQSATETRVTKVSTASGDINTIVSVDIDKNTNGHAGGFVRVVNEGEAYLFVGERHNRAQSTEYLNGKVLKLSESGHSVCAVGLRHPWRGEYIKSLDGFVFGDVGDHQAESLHIVKRDELCGTNFGYPIYEAGFIPTFTAEKWNAMFVLRQPTLHHLHRCKEPNTPLIDGIRWSMVGIFVGFSVISLVARFGFMAREVPTLRLIALALASSITIAALVDQNWRFSIGSPTMYSYHSTRSVNPWYFTVHFHEYDGAGDESFMVYWKNLYSIPKTMRITQDLDIKYYIARLGTVNLVFAYIIVCLSPMLFLLRSSAHLTTAIAVAGSIVFDTVLQVLFLYMFEKTFLIEFDKLDTITPVLFPKGRGFLLHVVAIALKGCIVVEAILAWIDASFLLTKRALSSRYRRYRD